ncbi:secreted ookinete protein, putative [Hepatocystis sp. ex Piliocolobus tephrosceles]|nr:secreted ookinete protein, putative [Hepatocystis sp. ex Piliocolobus tephrosceles]
MLHLKKVFCVFICVLFLLKKTLCFYFNVESELISDNENFKQCHKEHYLSFKGYITQVCLDKKVENEKKTSYNIIINYLSGKKIWIESSQVLDEYTEKEIKYFYSFKNNDKIVVIYCLSEKKNAIPNECYTSIYDELNHVITKPINIELETMDLESLTNYSTNELKLGDRTFILICGITSKKDLKNNFYVVCHGSNDEGITWEYQFLLSVPKVNSDIMYHHIILKVTEIEVGFLLEDTNTKLKMYMRCIYFKEYQYECYHMNFVRKNSYIYDLLKFKGYYLGILNNMEKTLPSMIYYMNKNTFLIPREIPKIEDPQYKEGNLYQLDNERVIYNYKKGSDKFTYILNHQGGVKHCTLLYNYKKHMNAGFIKENENFYCTVAYSNLETTDNNRILTISVINGVKTDIRKCFSYKLSDSFEPINLIHKITVTKEYENYFLYHFYIKKDLEKYFFLTNIKLECHLGDKFYLVLHLNGRNNYILDNLNLGYINNTKHNLVLYSNSVVNIILPKNNTLKNYIYETNFPTNTKYIKMNDFSYILLLPSYIENTNNIKIPFFQDNEKENYTLENVTIKNGGKKNNVIGVDFSNSKNICIYNGIYNNCSNIIIENNNVTINVNLASGEKNELSNTGNENTSSDIMLGIICPYNEKHKNTCFNSVYNDKHQNIYIRAYFNDINGYLTVLPNMFVLSKSDKYNTYEESNLILTHKFIKKFVLHKNELTNTFVCNCHAHNKTYKITFVLT